MKDGDVLGEKVGSFFVRGEGSINNFSRAQNEASRAKLHLHILPVEEGSKIPSEEEARETNKGLPLHIGKITYHMLREFVYGHTHRAQGILTFKVGA